ncbi:uncharacterized protein LOC5502472 [Nematostella vectensis]|uniref:uncharacterized protein LOC5502472 n=1 Tax=Nematostella vectensis TaxID=45351 RepID=UPI0013904D84|nr:uncharacterized protein LOC5502472 [Nematostella vectensis]
MAGYKQAFLLFAIFLAVFFTTVSFPDATRNAYRVTEQGLPKVAEFAMDAAVKFRDYCANDLNTDVTKMMVFVYKVAVATGRVIGPIGQKVGLQIWNWLVCIHDNAMSYTEDTLQQILGKEDYWTPDVISPGRHKLLSLILLSLWILTGILSISRMSYNKFFLVMSGTFLLHAVFGPVWCVRRMAFVIGLCMWAGSAAANKPIPAAVTILIIFLLTGIRKWRKGIAKAKSAADLLMFNKTMEQRMENLERKLDIVLAKVEFLVDKVPDRGCRHA